MRGERGESEPARMVFVGFFFFRLFNFRMEN